MRVYIYICIYIYFSPWLWLVVLGCGLDDSLGQRVTHVLLQCPEAPSSGTTRSWFDGVPILYKMTVKIEYKMIANMDGSHF